MSWKFVSVFIFGLILGMILTIIVLDSWKNYDNSPDDDLPVYPEPIIEEIDNTPPIPDEIQPESIVVSPKEVKRKRSSKGEHACRKILEGILGEECPNVRPNFLRNPETGRCLELDCYSERYKIALEYNGIQHYVWPNFTNQTKEEFILQARRDLYKVNMCDKHGIYLITVPYNIKPSNYKTYIEHHLRKIGVLKS